MTGAFVYLAAGAWQIACLPQASPFLGRGTAETDAKFLKEMNAVMQSSSGVRRFGSAALDLAFVAAGRYDGFGNAGSACGISQPVCCWSERQAAWCLILPHAIKRWKLVMWLPVTVPCMPAC